MGQLPESRYTVFVDGRSGVWINAGAAPGRLPADMWHGAASVGRQQDACAEVTLRIVTAVVSSAPVQQHRPLQASAADTLARTGLASSIAMTIRQKKRPARIWRLWRGSAFMALNIN